MSDKIIKIIKKPTILISFLKIILDKTIFSLIRKNKYIWPKYRIDNCKTYNFRDLVELKNPFTLSKPLQEYYEELKKIIKENLKEKRKFSIIRLGDGEAYFLQGKYHGNIKKRHLTDKTTNDLDLEEWKKYYFKNDLKTYDINWSLRKLWQPIEGKKIKNNFFPLNTTYALIATRDLFKITENYKVGIIGPESKIKIIKSLIKNGQYQQYLGIKHFSAYINVPQTGACNDVNYLFKNIVNQIKNSTKCDIYLVGIGIAKLNLLSRLRDELNIFLLDIGTGVDALAGIIPKDKPFFGDWVNYKIKNYDYDKINLLSQYTPTKTLNKFKIKKDIII